MKRKLIRTSTVPTSLLTFLDGQVEEMQARYDLVLLSSPGRELTELESRYGVRTIGIGMERRMAPLKDVKSLWLLVKVLRKERPAMVHSMTPKAGLLCMLAAWLTRVPQRVHTFTGLVWPTERGLKRRILMLTDWLTCACATHVIPEGQGVMNDLQRHITRKPMRVLGYGNVRGIDLERWQRANASTAMLAKLRRDDAFTFLFVGRIVRDKGIDELIEAFIQLDRHLKVRLVLTGRFEDALDPVAPTTRQTIERHPDIVVTGEQSGADLLACYAAADCFVFPSHREGFPNTVIEAGAMELPSIVTDINGSREIVRDGENGLVVPPCSAEALAAAMERIASDDALRRRLVANARPLIAARYEQGFVRRCLMDFYEECLGGDNKLSPPSYSHSSTRPARPSWLCGARCVSALRENLTPIETIETTGFAMKQMEKCCLCCLYCRLKQLVVLHFS